MALWGQSLVVPITAWNTATNAGQTGDAANLALRLVRDGTSVAPTNTPTEVDATNLPGVYKVTVTAAEMQANFVTVGGKSATANVTVMPTHMTTERGVLPPVAYAQAGGLPTIGTGSGQVALLNGGVTLAAQTHTGAVVPTVTSVTNPVTAGTVTDKSGYSLAASQAGVTIGTVTTLTGHTPQTGDAYARLGAPAGASLAVDVAAVKSDTAAVRQDTETDGVAVAAASKSGYSLAADQSAVTVGTVNDLGTTARSRVNAEVVDVMDVDVLPEPSQGLPPKNPTRSQVLAYWWMRFRNRGTQSETEQTVQNDAGQTLAKADVSVAGGVFTREKMEAGP